MSARPCRLFAATVLLALGVVSSATADEPIRRGLGPEPDSLDIHRAQGLTAINLLRDLREGLLTFDAAGEPAPGVASDWAVREQGRVYEFSLRPEARWSDGTPVTAGDFVRAWRRALSSESQAVMAGLMSDVRNAQAVMSGQLPATSLGVEAPDSRTLVVRLVRPAPWFPEILAHPVTYPVHPASAEPAVTADARQAREAPVNGAYVIDEWTPRSVIRLVANPQFHAADAVAAGRIEYYPIEEPNTELARYRAGEIDITETIPAGRYQWLVENLAEDLRISPYLGSFWLGLNLRDADLGDSAGLRRALALAVDRQTLVRVVLGAGERPAWGIVPPGMAGYDAARLPAAELSQAEREAEARRLYAEAGYGSERPLRLELRYNTSGLHRRLSVAVAAMWKQVLGVHTELINEEWKVFVNNRRMGVVTQVFRGGWIADYADPASFLDLFVSGSELNNTFHTDAAFDGHMVAAAGLAGDERMRRLRQAEARLLETLPVIPLYYYVSRHLVRPGLGGWVDNVRDIHLSRYLTLPP
ncbi:peptide ABC transporter substrate-binding protein [Elongatibacter sediminis]|uniref:Peptide ABC transporter substrate-binding protein n=1 Tax=Elongatibacter sediminis TaxID=3119006 RepID=A0AAW9R8P8_9GAMM